MKMLRIWDTPGATEKDRVLLECIKFLSDVLVGLYEQLERPTWRTYSGEVMAIADIKDGHLINCYLLQLRQEDEEGLSEIDKVTLGHLQAEIEKRGLQEKAGWKRKHQLNFNRWPKDFRR